MNERIKQLKHQASLWCDMNIPEKFSEDGYGSAWEDKFAELIVRECAGKVDWILAKGGKTQGDLIKQHFGVEE
jgi:hypothetical protein